MHALTPALELSLFLPSTLMTNRHDSSVSHTSSYTMFLTWTEGLPPQQGSYNLSAPPLFTIHHALDQEASEVRWLRVISTQPCMITVWEGFGLDEDAVLSFRPTPSAVSMNSPLTPRRSATARWGEKVAAASMVATTCGLSWCTASGDAARRGPPCRAALRKEFLLETDASYRLLAHVCKCLFCLTWAFLSARIFSHHEARPVRWWSVVTLLLPSLLSWQSTAANLVALFYAYSAYDNVLDCSWASRPCDAARVIRLMLDDEWGMYHGPQMHGECASKRCQIFWLHRGLHRPGSGVERE